MRNCYYYSFKCVKRRKEKIQYIFYTVKVFKNKNLKPIDCFTWTYKPSQSHIEDVLNAIVRDEEIRQGII